MKTENRVRHNAGKKSPSAQSESTPKNAPGKARVANLPPIAPGEKQDRTAALPVTINPSSAAIDMIDALALYTASLKDAGSLALLLADNIKCASDDFAGWECFAIHPGFADGLVGLANAALQNSLDHVNRVEKLYAPLIKRLRNVNFQVMSSEVKDWQAVLIEEYGYDDNALGEMVLDNSNTAMLDLLGLLSVTHDKRNLRTNRGGYFIAEMMAGNLKSMHKLFWDASKSLERAAVAVAMQNERKAAA